MFDQDIREIRDILEDIRSNINNGIMDQWNTFQYVAYSNDTKQWSKGTPVGANLVRQIRERSDWLENYAKSSLNFANAIEEYLDMQSTTNKGQ